MKKVGVILSVVLLIFLTSCTTFKMENVAYGDIGGDVWELFRQK